MGASIENEYALWTFFETVVAAGPHGTARFAARHPRAVIGAIRGLHRLPQSVCSVSETGEGAMVRNLLGERPGRRPLSGATSVLSIPQRGSTYTSGSSKQTLRRKVRAAERAGVTWRQVSDPAERRMLLAHADEFERNHAREDYRNPDADNSDILGMDMWLGAFAADGRPLMLSVTPHDGEWAALRYFRTISNDPAASDARYLLTVALVESLSRVGVRRLGDTVHPMRLPNGLRHFQRMIGFRLERVRFQPQEPRDVLRATRSIRVARQITPVDRAGLLTASGHARATRPAVPRGYGFEVEPRATGADSVGAAPVPSR